MSNQTHLPALAEHVVILNVNEKVGSIVDEILIGSAGEPPPIVIMVQCADLWREHPEWHPSRSEDGQVLTIEGCPAEPNDLERIEIARAQAAVILADPLQGQLADALSTLVAVAIERSSPRVHTVMELISSVHRVHLRSTEVNEVVCLGELTEQLIAQCCITPGIANVFASLLHAHPGTTQLFVKDLPTELEGMTYRQLVRRTIESGQSHILCGYWRAASSADPSVRGNGRPGTLVLNPRAGFDPGKDTPLAPGDQLLVLSYGPAVI